MLRQVCKTDDRRGWISERRLSCRPQGSVGPTPTLTEEAGKSWRNIGPPLFPPTLGEWCPRLVAEIPHISWTTKIFFFFKKKFTFCPGWCSSVDWVPACKPQGHWFNSQSGHMPGLWARSPVARAQGAATHWCFSPSLSLCLPLSLRINKSNIFF